MRSQIHGKLAVHEASAIGRYQPSVRQVVFVYSTETESSDSTREVLAYEPLNT